MITNQLNRTMQTSIIKIGNSKGVIIPKSLLADFSGKVEIKQENGGLFIYPVKEESRKGWDILFKEATKDNQVEGDLFVGVKNDFDKEEWTW